MAKAESTRKDMEQDAAEEKTEKKVAAGQVATSDLERRVAQLERDVQILAPLSELLGAVTQIRRHFGVV